MILGILAMVMVTLIIYVIRQWYIVPKRTMQKYAKDLKSLGYRVCELPYNPLFNYYQWVIFRPNKQYGDPFRVFKQIYPHFDAVVTNLKNKPFIQLLHPDLIRQFYAVDKHYTYPKLYQGISFIVRFGGHGLPLSQGAQWKRKRTIFNKIFNFDFIKSQAQKIAQIGQNTMQKMEKIHSVTISQSGQKIAQYNILQLCIQTFGQVMLSIFLGMGSQQKIQGIPVASYIKKLVDDSTALAFTTLGLAMGPKLHKAGIRSGDRDINRRGELYRNWAMTYISQRVSLFKQKLQKNKQVNKPSDILEALIMDYLNTGQKKIKNANDTNQFSQEQKQIDSMLKIDQLFEEFTSFFFAGTQTTSNYLQMIIYYIAQNPRVEAKLRDEISQFMSNDDYSYQNLKNLKYIDNIQKQTTRIYGPSIFLFWRYALQDNYLGQLAVKKDTIVTPLTFGNHFSQKYFKNPSQFRPQRWDEDQCKNLPAFAYNGFSAGARSCIGKQLALLQSKVVLIKFMKRYKKITLLKENFKMQQRFVLGPENFNTKLIIYQ